MDEAGPFAAMAQKHPGRLLQRATLAAERCLPPRPAAAVAECPLAPRWQEYLQTQRGVRDARNLQEAGSIAVTLDCLIAGRLLQAGDILVQRLKAIEMVEQGATRDAAHKLEITPTNRSMLTDVEKVKASRAASSAARVEKALTGGAGK